MLVVGAGGTRRAERDYAVSVVLAEFLGLPCRFEPDASAPPGVWTIRASSHDGPVLQLPDIFFPGAHEAWLQPASLPVGLLDAAPEAALPPAFAAPPTGRSGPRWFGYDVFGAAFFMLTRYEEVVLEARDGFGRFQAASSKLAGWDPAQPFIDQAVRLLARRLLALWPGLPQAAPAYEVRVTHDVDALRNRGRRVRAIVAAAGADLLRRREPALAARRVGAWLGGPRERLDPRDPFNTFDFLMTQSERHGLRSHFYFVPEPVSAAYDPAYTVRDPDVRALLAAIGSRGHRVGLHAGFDAAYQPGRVAREFALLREAAEASGLRQDEWGGRHHYLRWRPEVSWSQWDEAGADYDSSVGFAELPGFRCGTCRPFTVWSLAQNRRLRLRERPLVVMESTLFSYQHLQDNAALDAATRLAARCREFAGTFVLLWHNHNLLTRASRHLYQAMLEAIAD